MVRVGSLPMVARIVMVAHILMMLRMVRAGSLPMVTRMIKENGEGWLPNYGVRMVRVGSILMMVQILVWRPIYGDGYV